MRSMRRDLIGAAGLVLMAGGAAARADGPADAGAEFLPARIVGHVYLNARTGEVTTTPVGAARSGDLFWENDDIPGSCNFFYGQDRPTRDTTATGRAKFGSALVHWGDLPTGSRVGGYDVAYATDIGSDTSGGWTTGLDMVNVFLDDYDGTVAPGGIGAASVAGAYIIHDLSFGAPGTLFQGWFYTVDLEGSGLEFMLAGADVDGDGLHDFAYSYEFVQGQGVAKGIIGPYLVRPFSLGGAGTATGCPDAFDWFNQPGGSQTFTDYVGSFWLGGGSCPTTPYASLYMNLYGVEGGSRCAAIDYTADGIIDFQDYLEFLNRFEALDPSADLDGDGVIEFRDWQEFYTRYFECQG